MVVVAPVPKNKNSPFVGWKHPLAVFNPGTGGRIPVQLIPSVLTKIGDVVSLLDITNAPLPNIRVPALREGIVLVVHVYPSVDV